MYNVVSNKISNFLKRVRCAHSALDGQRGTFFSPAAFSSAFSMHSVAISFGIDQYTIHITEYNIAVMDRHLTDSIAQRKSTTFVRIEESCAQRPLAKTGKFCASTCGVSLV